MKINGKHYRTIWVNSDGWSIGTFDQTLLPHKFEIITLKTIGEVAHAIKTMQVRGAPLIGAAAAYGIYLQMPHNPSHDTLYKAITYLAEQRPTAVNLFWALGQMRTALEGIPYEKRATVAYQRAADICNDDVETCRKIGMHGLQLIKKIASGKPKGESVNILTHCNAGWLATVDWGTATSPIYQAHDSGIKVHVWVDETRPRNQGSSLTAYELGSHGVPYTIIVDSAGGHLMQRGFVDLCIVGTDRTTSKGDVANKIGTYLKALAAKDNGVPFYVALPYSTIDWTIEDGMPIPIEERSEDEILKISGRPAGSSKDTVVTINIAGSNSPTKNPAFDVTPNRLITGLITERGITEANRDGLARLYE